MKSANVKSFIVSEKRVFVVTKLSTFTDLHGHKGLLPGLLVRLATV